MAIGYIDVEEKPKWLLLQWNKEIEFDAKQDRNSFKKIVTDEDYD